MTLKPTLRLLLALTVLAGSAAPPAHAQEEAAERLRRTVSTLGDSTRLRLWAPGIIVSDGFFLSLQGDTVQVADADAVLSVGLDEIEALSVQGSKWLGVGLQTAAVTAVAGAVAGYFFGAHGCVELAGCDEEALGQSLRWGLGFGLAGGVVGGFAGSRIGGWKEVFP